MGYFEEICLSWDCIQPFLVKLQGYRGGGQVGSFNSECCMVDIGHTDTGFPIETLGPSKDTSIFISFNSLVGWPDKNRDTITFSAKRGRC